MKRFQMPQLGWPSRNRSLFRMEVDGDAESLPKRFFKDVVVQGRFSEETRVQVLLNKLGRWETILDATSNGFGSLLVGSKGHTLRIVVEGTSTGYVEVT